MIEISIRNLINFPKENDNIILTVVKIIFNMDSTKIANKKNIQVSNRLSSDFNHSFYFLLLE